MTLKNYFDGFGNKVNPGQYFFGGPKVPSAPKQPKQVEQPMPVMPVTPIDPPAPIPPAPTTSKLEVQQASDDEKQQAARRKGVRQTILAGETGGYGSSPTNEAGQKTLLG